MKFEVSFRTVNDNNPVIKAYDYHPLYEEIKNTFNTFLSSPVSITDEKYIEKNDWIGDISMIKHTLTYSVSLNEIAHLEATIKLLENLDLDCDFKVKED